MYVLGLDIGTSGVKTLLVDHNGKPEAESNYSYPVLSPATNWFEQNPEDWWNAVKITIRDVIKKSGVSGNEIFAIGLSGQYHGSVFLDDNGEVVRPCILWNDQRTKSQSDRIAEKAGTEKLNSIACTNGGLYFTACKMLWLEENEPENYEKVKKLLLPKDYVRYKLTGEYATDVTDASGTLLLNVPERKWSDEMCEITGISSSVLPELYESAEVTGKLLPSVAAELGLHDNVIVAGGGGDQACAAIGNGIVDEGLVSYSVGTSGVIYAAANEPKFDPDGRLNTFCHAVPGKWGLLAVINAAAASFEWFKNNLNRIGLEDGTASGGDVYDLINAGIAEIPPGSDKLVFLPYLSGERHPHNNPFARGVFFGLHSGHKNAHLARAVMEGVSFSFGDCLGIMEELGVNVDSIRGTGGGMKSGVWRRMQADISRKSIFMSGNDSGGAAFGAGILALVSSGHFKDVTEACQNLVHFDDQVKPDNKNAAVYNKYFNLYRGLYQALEDYYLQLEEI